jgi:hypothetical protein
MRWVAAGAPREKPKDWNAGDWQDAQAFKRYYDLQGGSSYALAGLSPDMADSLGLALDNHNVVRAMLERQARAKATADGWSETELEGVLRSAGELTNRLQVGLEPIDEAIGKMIASPDPVAHSRSFGGLTATSLYMDIVLAKYPAYLKARHDFPDATEAQLVAYSSAPAGDLRNVSQGMMRHLAMHSPLGNELWMKTTPYAGVKVALSMLFRNRIWAWRNSTLPLYLQTVARHPISSIGAGSVVGIGVAALVNSITQQDPEEAERFEEEMRHAQRGAFYNYAVPPAERDALARTLGKSRIPGLAPRSPLLKEQLSTFWNKVLHGFAAEGGKRQGEARLLDLRDLTGPIGEVVKTAETVNALYQLTTGNMSARKLADVTNFGERILGMHAQLAASMLLGGPEEMVDAMHGKTTWGESFMKSLRAFGRMMPEFYPVLGMLSPSGQHLGENVNTKGMPFNDYVAGLERAHRGETSLGLLAEAAGTAIWPSRAIRQRPALTGPTEVWSTLGSVVLGESIDPKTERGKRSMLAAQFVARELNQVIGDLFQLHKKEIAQPETTEIEFDDRLAGAFTETLNETVEVLPGRWEIKPGYQPKGAILKAISNAVGEDRSERIRYFRKYYAQESFQEAGMNALLEAGRRTSMGVGLFKEAMRRTMIDPSSTQLLSWWWNEIKGGNAEAMRELAPLLDDTPIPADGSEAFGYWLDIRRAYDHVGIELPVGMSDEHRAAIEKRMGTHPMLQGGGELLRALQSRPLIPR